MAHIAGSIESISLAGRSFAVPADTDVQRELGGWKNALLPNGGGSAAMQKTRIPWSLTGLVIRIDDSRGDQEYITNLKAKTDWYPITITYVDGSVYQGRGQIIDETASSNQNASMPVSLSGPGKLTKQ